eukprot:jgi/Tetstr1/442424/TSEL_030548.t1
MASASTFHNAAGPDDASWKGFMLQSGSPEPPHAPRGPPLRYYLTTPAASEFCRKCGKSTTVDGLPVVGEEALVSAVTEAMCDRMNGHGHHMELPTGYSVGPSDPKAWPFLAAFDDPKVYAMRELHALCEAHFMHPMDDSDALRDVMGWDSAHQSRHRFP